MRQPVPFGKYLLLDRISVGGMAEVFKAKSYGVEGFEKIIAIKRILPTMGEDRDFIKMFIDEAKIAGQLAHANICQIFELGRIDGSHFIAMEYIWGKDLLQIQNRLRKIKQPMPVPMACFVIAKVLEGLDYAHRKRDPLGRPLEIVHRDCSPQNVLVSYEGEVKVIDFGIAKATSRNSRTMAGVLKGKFGYMSPEQVRGLPLDRRSDLFALGTMLYECLTSDRLFQGETDFSTLEKVRNVDIRPPRELNPAIPDVVEKVILKALAKDVDDRYQWCSEMLADIQQFLMSQDVVFTAKSLSSWLKDVFSAEIDKERQQLEQYKRVGRDGLIAGVPAAEAKLDVVEHLGEAGPVEGDATQLGGPSFDDIEHAVAASAALEVGPAPGSPAARGSVPARPGSEDDGDFGEEAPTEIFGEIDHGAKPTPPISAPMAARPGTGSQPPRPAPKAPSAPRVTGPPRPGMGSAPPMMAGAAPSEATMNITENDIVGGLASDARDAYARNFPQLAAQAQPGGYMQPNGGAPAYPGYPVQGTPPNPSPGVPMPLNALAPPGAQTGGGKTLMGAAAPPGLPNYGSYPPNQMPGHMQGSMPPYQQPQQAYGQHQHPSQPQMGGYGQHHQHHQHPSQPQMIAHHPSGYPSAQNYLAQGMGYGNPQAGNPYQAALPVDHQAPVPMENRKKSSIGRDIAIGVAIAAVVLGGFLVVKFFVLDSDDESATAGSGGSTGAAEIATLRIEMPQNVTADLFLDDGATKVATIKNGDEVPVNAGSRKIKIVAANGQHCDQELTLAPKKTMTVVCNNLLPDKPDTGSASGTDPAKDPSKVATNDPTKDPAKTDPSKTDPAKTDPSKTDPSKTDPSRDPSKTDPKVDPAKTDPTKDPTKIAKTDPTKDPSKDPTKTDPTKIAKTDPTKDPTKTDPTKLDPTKKPPKDRLPPEDNPADRAANVGKNGFLVVTSSPSAKIAIDGADTGKSTPTGKISLLPGKHKVQFILGGDKSTFTVTIKAGETATLHKDLQ